MKMVKSLLLGSAAGLVAVTAGQAAELPVKAKPVQYVKVCSLYGAGFYYMPGTDMCIKLGGWVRAEFSEGTNGNITWGPFNNNAQNRLTSNITARARGYVTADAREQTAYGVARGYIAVGIASNDVGLGGGVIGPAASYANRAYVQWAGFTAGLAQSFYDFYSLPAAQYRGGYTPGSDTGDGGWWVWGYTAQFGGGFSATLSIEQRRTTQIIDGDCTSNTAAGLATCGSIVPGAYPTQSTAGGAALTSGSGYSPGFGAYGGWQAPDIIANLRVDQAWGSAQVMAAAHEVNASYYGSALTGAPTIAAAGLHPSDTWGWALGAGLKVNFPSIAPGDYLQTQFNYTVGASRYSFNTPNTNYGITSGGGASESYGVLSDCVYGGFVTPAGVSEFTTGCQLTTTWGFNASYEHYWTPNWHQSLYGAYYQVSYDSSANAMLCTFAGFGVGGIGSAAAAFPGCNNNWTTWNIGTRLQWDVTKSFYIGVEALYSQLDSAQTGTPIVGFYAPGGSTGTGVDSLVQNSTSVWSFTARMHKDFLP